MNPHRTRLFRHYKNKPYRYLGIVRHSETLEELVHYEALYENKLGSHWVRPKEMFFESVFVDGQKLRRFVPVEFKIKTFEVVNSELLVDIKSIYQKSFDLQLDETHFISKVEAHKSLMILMAFDNKMPVAMKIGFPLDKRRFYSWQGAVVPEFQGLGLASELMRLQHSWCLGNGFQTIETRTRNKYKQMISLNLNHSFEIVGTMSDKKGVKIIFEKTLSSNF